MSEMPPGPSPEEERKIASRREDLPPLKEGYVRLIHVTGENITDSILETGLNYEKQGMIDATARAYGNEADVEYDDPNYLTLGNMIVVLDVPIEEYRIHRDITKSQGVIPSEYVVGVFDVKNQEE